MVRTSKGSLKKMIQGDKVNWDLHLSSVQMSMNYKIMSSIDASPHSLMFTRPVNNLANHTGVESNLLSPPDLKALSARALEYLYPSIQEFADGIRSKMAVRVDRSRLPHVDFGVGDTVITVDDRRASKMDPRYLGPYTVVSIDKRNGCYRLTDSTGLLLKKVFPAHKLDRIASPTDDGPHYVVEKVCDHRGRSGKREYLVKWKGFPSSDNTWEPVSNFDSHECISEYLARSSRPKRSNISP
jgi:hypothetical protein